MVSKYSGKDFLEQLRGGSLKPSLFLFGIAKHTDDSEYISFSSNGCGEWISIPLDMVESVEVLGWSYCRDHMHPRVRLQLIEAATDNLHAQVFGQLLRAQSREVIGDATIADGSQADGRVAARARQPGLGPIRKPPVGLCHEYCSDLRGREYYACFRRCLREWAE